MHVLRGVNFEVEQGEFTVISGPTYPKAARTYIFLTIHYSYAMMFSAAFITVYLETYRN